MLKLTQRDNMKFKELREANLSKAQIKKVHDKADDLPKNDFIKRYGKDGDSVRFATATNIVKKKLGMDEGIFGKLKFPRPDVVNKPLPSKDSYGRGDVKTIELPIPGTTFKGKLNGSKKSEALDKEDEKSVGRVVKGLKKAVKAHQGQVDALTKDIKDEVAPVDRAKAALDVAVAKKSAKAAAAVKQKTKDKADVQRLLDRQKRLRAVARRNEEVVTEAVSAVQVNQISRMTDRNDHFGARIELARIAGDKELMRYYDSLEKMHKKLGSVIGDSALVVRQKLEAVLKSQLQRRFGDKDAKRFMDAL